jgi:quinol monooxygenase YgiN
MIRPDKNAQEEKMIHVVATIRVMEGGMPQFLQHFKDNVPNVLAEEGCIEYRPTVDLDAGLPRQVLAANVMVLIEKWTSLEALRTHLTSPHMLAYREKVKGLVLDTSLKVLQDAG